MKAAAIFVAFVAVVMFFNAPAETAEHTADSLGINPIFALGALAIAGLFFLLRGSRDPR